MLLKEGLITEACPERCRRKLVRMTVSLERLTYDRKNQQACYQGVTSQVTGATSFPDIRDHHFILSALFLLAEHLMKTASKTKLYPYTFSVCIGISCYDPENPVSIDEMLQKADKLMYEEKRFRKQPA